MAAGEEEKEAKRRLGRAARDGRAPDEQGGGGRGPQPAEERSEGARGGGGREGGWAVGL